MDRQASIPSASDLPEVEQGAHWIFATLTLEDIAGFKLTPEVQAMLMTKSPLAGLTPADAEFALREE